MVMHRIEMRSISINQIKYGMAAVFSQFTASKGKVRATSCASRIVVGLKSHEFLSFVGGVSFRVVKGCMLVYGFHATRNEYYDAYSAEWSSLVTFEGADSCTEHMCEFKGQKLKVHPSSVSKCNADQEADGLADQMCSFADTVVILKPVERTLTNVDCMYTTDPELNADSATDASKLFFGFRFVQPNDMRTLDDQSDERNAEQKLFFELSVPPNALPSTRHPLHISASWKTLMDEILPAEHTNSTTAHHSFNLMVCGAKGVGKSTFCRYTVNRLLRKHPLVAFLDTDLGQPELTPSGLVSLHVISKPLIGPAHTHMAHPYRAFFLGEDSPKNDPIRYRQSVEELMNTYRSRWGEYGLQSTQGLYNDGMPLLINTDGWIKGLGHDLLLNLMQNMSPSHVVQLTGASKSRNFDLPPSTTWTTHVLSMWKMDAPTPSRHGKDLNRYRWRSYFLPNQQLIGDSQEKGEDSIPRILSSMRCFKFPFSAVEICILNHQVPPTQVLYALNGSIVGLAVNKTFPKQISETTKCCLRIVPRELNYADGEAPERFPCLGLGIIKHIDVQEGCFHVLSPIPDNMISIVNVLLKGSIPTPSIFYEKGPASHSAVPVPYYVTDVLSSSGSGSRAIKSRKNLKRRKEEK